MHTDRNALYSLLGSVPQSATRDIEKSLSSYFDKCGLFYRIFCRCKSAASVIEKLNKKESEYREKGKKMQDLIGARVALYFKDDIQLCINIIEKLFTVIEIVRDEETSDKFSPMRLNIVCEMPENTVSYLPEELWEDLIDKTFEIQIRTVFSEGWHEVEHDLRYKHKSDWIDHVDLSRNLNGIYATLESCDWAILNVFDQLAYQKYLNGDWDAMLRNHLRIRLDNAGLSEKITDLFNKNPGVAKEFFRIDRNQFLLYLSSEYLHNFPNNLNNMVYIANELIIKNKEISLITPEVIKTHLSEVINEVIETKPS